MRETIVCALLNSHRRAACVGLARKKKKKKSGEGEMEGVEILENEKFRRFFAAGRG